MPHDRVILVHFKKCLFPFSSFRWWHDFPCRNLLVSKTYICPLGCGIFFIFEHRRHKILIRRACSKVLKIFFSNIVVWRVFEHWTQISNQFWKCRKMFECGFWKILEFYSFFNTYAVNFQDFWKMIRYFVFSVLMRVFWTVTRLY